MTDRIQQALQRARDLCQHANMSDPGSATDDAAIDLALHTHAAALAVIAAAADDLGCDPTCACPLNHALNAWAAAVLGSKP